MIACLFALYLSNHSASLAKAVLQNTRLSVGLVSPATEGTPAPPQPPDLLLSLVSHSHFLGPLLLLPPWSRLRWLLLKLVRIFCPF